MKEILARLTERTAADPVSPPGHLPARRFPPSLPATDAREFTRLDGTPLKPGDEGQNEQQRKIVFISYATPDIEKARTMIEAFEASGNLRCWFAPRDIAPGSNFNAEIVKAIDRCTDFVLLFSKHSNESTHVKRELYLWQEHGKPIIPVRMDTTAPSPEFRYLLAGMQWATATDDRALLELIGKPA